MAEDRISGTVSRRGLLAALVASRRWPSVGGIGGSLAGR